MKKEIEMKNDGHDLERFQDMLKTVVNVPKKKLDERQKVAKEKKDAKRKA